MRRKKGLLRVFLALLLALTTVVPAHAETVMRSRIALPDKARAAVVDVTVPATGQLILNPYGLPVEIGGETTTEQIASETMPITNNGDTPVTVSTSVVGKVSASSSMVLVGEEPQADAVKKELYLYAEFQNEDDQWTNSYSGDANQILISDRASSAQEVLSLDANAEGVFRLFGATAVSPEDEWNEEDKVMVTFTFTFDPVTDSGDAVAEEPTEEPAEDPTEDPSTEDPSENPAEQPTEKPSEDPAEPPAEDPSEDPAEPPAEEPSEDPAEQPTEKPSENPAEQPTEKPSENPAEQPTEKPSEDPAEQPTETPSEDPTEQPTEKPSEDPAEPPAEDPSEDPAEPPAEEPSEDPAEPPTEDPSEDPAEPPAEGPSEDPAEPPTEKPSEDPAEPPTEKPSEDPAEPPTEKPSEEPAEEPSEKIEEVPEKDPEKEPDGEAAGDEALPSQEDTSEPGADTDDSADS